MSYFNFTTAKLAALRSYVAEHGITVTGDKRKPESFRKAIAAWIDSKVPTMAELSEAAERIGDFFEAKAAEVQDAATSEAAIAKYSAVLRSTRAAGLFTAKVCYVSGVGLLKAAWLLMVAYALLSAALMGAAGRWGADLGDTLGAALKAAVAEANAPKGADDDDDGDTLGELFQRADAIMSKPAYQPNTAAMLTVMAETATPRYRRA